MSWRVLPFAGTAARQHSLVTAMGMVRGLLSVASARAWTRPATGYAGNRFLPRWNSITCDSGIPAPAARRRTVGQPRADDGAQPTTTKNQPLDRMVRTAVEPLLMTFIGLLIGVIVILMYIPIFELSSSIH
jgi:hypothetical protein